MRHVVLAAVLLIAASCGSPAVSPTSLAPTDPDATSVPSGREATPEGTPEASDLTGIVAYVGGADPQIYLLDLATGESSQLTHLTAADAELTGSGPVRPALTCGFGPNSLEWSPDGTRLAFTYGDCDSVVYVVNLDGAVQRVGDGRNPTWSPDGTRLAFEQNFPYLGRPENDAWPLLTIDTTGGDTAPVPLGEVPLGFSASAPKYSPNGALIALSGPPPEGGEDPMATAAYVMRSDGTSLRVVARSAYAWLWLPDGRMLITDPSTGRSTAIDLSTGATTEVAGGDPVEDVSPDGWILASTFAGNGNRVRLYDPLGELTGEIGGSAPTWSPDGSAFLINDVEPSVLAVFARDGGELGTYRLVAPVGGDYRARWQPSPATP